MIDKFETVIKKTFQTRREAGFTEVPAEAVLTIVIAKECNTLHQKALKEALERQKHKYYLTKLIWSEIPQKEITKNTYDGYKLIGEALNDKGEFLQLAVHINKGAGAPEHICHSINRIIEHFKNK